MMHVCKRRVFKLTKKQELIAYLHLLYDQPVEEKLAFLEKFLRKNEGLFPLALKEAKKIAVSELEKCRICDGYKNCMKDKESKAYKLEKEFG